MKTINVGMIGRGFMSRAHSDAYLRVGRFFDLDRMPVLKAACSRNEAHVREFASRWGYESIETDWRRIVERDDIDLIDICTPNNLHADIAIAAAEAGKMIICEKPLAMDVAQGRRMVEAVENAGVSNLVSFNYRRIPAVCLAKNLIDEEKLGRIFHYRANFLQDWTISADVPQGGDSQWRMDSTISGSGVTGDLLAHCIDTALWLNGPIREVSAMTETFIKERADADTGEMRPVGIDDACAFLARFENGSIAVFESTRYARGHKALYTFEINGEDASIAWDLHDMNRLSWFDHEDEDIVRGWKSIHVTDGKHPYMDHWWVPGLQIGYESTFVHQLADFFGGIAANKPAGPTFRDALETQKVCEAVLASAKSRRWVDID